MVDASKKRVRKAAAVTQPADAQCHLLCEHDGTSACQPRCVCTPVLTTIQGPTLARGRLTEMDKVSDIELTLAARRCGSLAPTCGSEQAWCVTPFAISAGRLQ